MKEHEATFSLVFSWTPMSQGCALSSAELPDLHLTKSQSERELRNVFINSRRQRQHCTQNVPCFCFNKMPCVFQLQSEGVYES